VSIRAKMHFFFGMVEAMVKKTERLAAGKSLRNMHYTNAFAQLRDTLGTISRSNTILEVPQFGVMR
jgi:hypothetical protein